MRTLAEYILHLKDVMPLDMCQSLIEKYDSISEHSAQKRDNAIYKFDEINMLNNEAFSDFR